MSTKETMKKLNMIKQDILRLLQSVEPQTMFYRDIKEQLAPKHKSKYKDDRVYGSALAYHLNWLLGKGLIKKDEETLQWGTLGAYFNQGREIRSKKSEPSIICSFLSDIVLVIFYILIWINMRPEVHRAVNMLNSTLTTTPKQVILLAIETYPYVLTLVAIFHFLALRFHTLKYPNYSANSLR